MIPLRIGGFVLVLLVVLGCGQQQRARLTGGVTLDGAPLAAGAIRLTPIDGKSPTAGATIEDGKYVIENAPITRVRVEITASKVVGKRKAYDTPDSPMVDIVKELLPARYNTKSDLERDVQKGENQFDFTLSTK